MTIGVFDSGVGGLSVLAEIRRLLPDAAVVYVADSAHAPYGERSAAAVRARAEAITEELVRRGCSPIVLACNSASAAALHHLRRRYPRVRFVGMEPAVKPAAGVTRRGVVGVLATEATFRGEPFASVVDRHARSVSVVTRTCPGLAAAIERGDEAETSRLVDGYVGRLVDRGVDTIVLACTHYSLVADRIAAAAGTRVVIVDPTAAVARRVADVAADSEAGPLRYLTTGDPDAFRERLRALAPGLPPLDGDRVDVARLAT